MFPQNPQPGSNPQQYYQDFVNRYQQSPQGVSQQEALNNYHQVAPQLPPNVYQQAAQDAFARMTPEERMQFGRYVAQQTQQQGYNFIDMNQDGIDDRLQDPDFLAQKTTQVEQEEPGLLGRLFGGGNDEPQGAAPMSPPATESSSEGILSSPWAKGALGGIAAYGAARMLGGGSGGGGLFGGEEERRGGGGRRRGGGGGGGRRGGRGGGGRRRR
jgi:hypothetical protein